MKIDLNYLNRFSKLSVDESIELDESLYKNTDIRALKDLHVTGNVEIDYEDNLRFNLEVSGIMVLPCAVTLKDVDYSFSSIIDETIGNFDEIYKKYKNSLEISDVLWENIVLEIPIRVVSSDNLPSNTSGDGWELIS